MNLNQELEALLTELKFTKYQSKIYATLLLKGPLTAAEIAKHSGVPRPKIYDNLEILNSRNAVEVYEGIPKKYSAVSIKEVVEIRLQDNYSRFKTLKNNASKLHDYLIDNDSKESEDFFVWIRDTKGKADAIRKATYYLRDAKKTIYVSSHKYPMTPELYRTFLSVIKKGVKVRVIGEHVENFERNIELYKKAGCEIAQVKNVLPSFFSIDSNLLLLPSDKQYNNFIKISDSRMVVTFDIAFDSLWSDAKKLN